MVQDKAVLNRVVQDRVGWLRLASRVDGKCGDPGGVRVVGSGGASWGVG